MSSKKSKVKKVSQNDLRKMMNEMKTKRTAETPSKVADGRSILAKPDAYKKALNDQKKLQALTRETRTESTQNIQQKKEHFDSKMNSKSLKRPLSAKTQISDMTVEIENGSNLKKAKIVPKARENEKNTGRLLIGDYSSDSEEEENENNVEGTLEQEPEEKDKETKAEEAKKSDSSLPAGFFDDAQVDAKIRGVETPAHAMDREWEEFQKEIQRETGQSEQIVDEEEETGKVDREIEEIDEQMMHFSRVEKLNVTRDEVRQKLKPVTKSENNKSSESDMDDSDSEDIDDELMDWREKDSHF